MSKPLDITQRQAKALMKAAKEVGCAVEFDPKTGMLRILPDVPKGKGAIVPMDKQPEGYF